MSADYDAIVVGGGHNGLTAAAYLAAGGARTLVLEARDVVGGAAVTEEIHPGYRCSTASYVVSLLRPEVVRELALERHGYEPIPLESRCTLLPDGRSLLLTGDADHDRAEVAGHSNRDHAAMQRFEAAVEAVSDVVRDAMLRPPPRLAGGGLGDLIALLRLGNGFRRLSADHRHRAVQLFTAGAGDILERWFDSEIVRCKYAASVAAGAFVDLRQPGSAINLLHLTIGEVGGVRGRWGLARGGMGAITAAMAAACRERGVEIRTGTPVARIVVRGGRAVGVALPGGEEITARVVLANTDPRRTFLDLVGADALDADFAADIAAYKCESATFRMSLALSGLPELAARPGSGAGAAHRGFLALMPGWEETLALYHVARLGGVPETPIVAAMIPSVLDDTLAPEGGHVMTLLCKYFPYRLADGRSWDDAREAVADAIVERLATYMPGLEKLIVGRHLLSPRDLERTFGLTGGDVYHGQLSPDQLFSLRPHPMCAQYATPLAGLYLCGAGTHPGGGVSGAPGRNAAKRVLGELR